MVEHEVTGWMDRISLLIGRITMILIAVLVLVMLYEVILRYVFERPTLWANELSLWMAGFVFLFSGLYAMQQRSHIRIYLLYDVMPRWLQKTCDVVSTALIVAFAFAIVWGGYNEAPRSNASARDFLAFVRGEDGRRIIAAAGYGLPAVY
jgi:TRAP-type C4-dicarboxylate transport system permease small subunit